MRFLLKPAIGRSRLTGRAIYFVRWTTVNDILYYNSIALRMEIHAAAFSSGNLPSKSVSKAAT